MKKKLVVLTGAGISAESGIKTFRDSDGLWEGHDVMEVATPEGWRKNPALVLDFYNQRRKQLLEVKPNLAHQVLVDLEQDFEVYIVTQNVDDLHERAGSQNVLHLHGELLKVRSTRNESYVLDWRGDLQLGDFDTNGNQLRPHIVWFGEMPFQMETIYGALIDCDLFISIGTSGNVYPAAGFVQVANETGAHTIELNLDPSQTSDRFAESKLGKASVLVPQYVDELLALSN